MSAKKDDGFVHLHNHTGFSSLDGLSRLDEMCDYVVEQGQPAAAMTDHGNSGGAWKFAKAAMKAGIKPIIGQEFYLAIPDHYLPGGGPSITEGTSPRFRRNAISVTEGEETDADDDGDDDSDSTAKSGPKKKVKRYEHLTVLAQNEQGWRNLVRITNASQDTYWYKPRADMELLAENAEGLIVLTGCLGGPVAGRLLAGDEKKARENLAFLKDSIAPGNLFVEVMDHGIKAERAVMGGLVKLAKEFELPVVATNDAHYIHPDDAHAHDAWLCVGTKKRLDDEKRFRFHGEGYHLRSSQDMHDLFDGQNGTEKACSNTLQVAEKVSDSVLPKAHLRLPKFPETEGKSSKDYLYELVQKGAVDRYGKGMPQYIKDRLRRELNIIHSKGFDDYFLIVWDVIRWARDQGIRVGPGRGSAAGSAVSYCLRIVNVDPIANNLLFERFLDDDRDEMPDIDTDFEEKHRPRVIEYISQRYDLDGRSFVARIGTFGVSRSRSSVKDAARTMDLREVGERMSKLVPIGGGGKPLAFDVLLDAKDSRGEDFRDLAESDPDAARVLGVAVKFESNVAREGIHACGVLVSDEPLEDLIPLRRDRAKGGSGGLVTQWDGKDVSDYGLLKLDILGLRNLDIISEAVRQIERTTGEVVDPDEPPTDLADPRVRKTWDLIADGKTSGVFQLASEGMTKLCQRVRPDRLADLSAVVALYRPGPLGAQMHDRFALRKRGEEKVDYTIYTSVPAEQEQIATVLGETMGTCLARGQRVYSASRGLMVPIEDIVLGETVQGVDKEGRHVLAPVTNHVNNGAKPTVKLKFSSGATLTVTPDHRVLTTDGWKQAGDLTDSDAVAAPWSLLADTNVADKQRDDREIAEARLLGYLLADGGITPGTDIYFFNSDLALLDTVAKVGLAAFPDTKVTHYEPNARGVGRVRFTGSRRGHFEQKMLAWLRECGLKTARHEAEQRGVHSRGKFIPDAYLSRRDESALALLGAMWDCDGRIGDGSGGNPHLTYKTISKQLSDDVCFLLARFGISATVTEIAYENPSGSSEIAYNIGVLHVERFVELVVPHMASSYKIEASRALRGPLVRRQFGSYVPVRNVTPVKSEVGAPWKLWLRANGFGASTLRGSKFIGAETVADLAAASGSSELARLSLSRWLRVVSVDVSSTSEVFDITVGGVHNFVAEGVVVHNCVYQEHLMRLGTLVAGFGPVTTNELRRAISKKVPEEIARVEKLFMSGAQAKVDDQGATKMSYLQSTAANLWRMFEKSGDYLFNASHSYAYGFLAYVTAFLKANWPAQYGAALLSATEDADQRLSMMLSLRAEGITVLGPDINTGQVDSSLDDQGHVRLGLSEVAGVKSNAAIIVAEREKNGPFLSLVDLLGRVRVMDKGQLRSMPNSIFEALVESGACDSIVPGRMGAVSVLRGLRDNPDIVIPNMEWGVIERSQRERSRLGVAVSAHPLKALKDNLKQWKDPESRSTPVTLTAVLEERSGRAVSTIGVVSYIGEFRSRSGRMARLTLEGSSASVDCVIFPKTYRHLLDEGTVPVVGQVIGVTGHTEVTEVAQHVPMGLDFDDDDEDEDATLDVVVETKIKHKVLIDQLFDGPLDDAATTIGQLPAARHLRICPNPNPDPEPESNSDSENDLFTSSGVEMISEPLPGEDRDTSAPAAASAAEGADSTEQVEWTPVLLIPVVAGSLIGATRDQAMNRMRSLGLENCAYSDLNMSWLAHAAIGEVCPVLTNIVDGRKYAFVLVDSLDKALARYRVPEAVSVDLRDAQAAQESVSSQEYGVASAQVA